MVSNLKNPDGKTGGGEQRAGVKGISQKYISKKWRMAGWAVGFL